MDSKNEAFTQEEEEAIESEWVNCTFELGIKIILNRILLTIKQKRICFFHRKKTKVLEEVIEEN